MKRNAISRSIIIFFGFFILLLKFSSSLVYAAPLTFPTNLNSCGNGVLDIQYGEQCDDGNDVSGDGCNIVCEKEYGLQSKIVLECLDGIDNDLDGLNDMDDPGCNGSTDDDEWNSLGVEYYVDPNGSDSGSGTLGDPWRTIDHAVNFADSGDTIFLREGIHSEGVLNYNGVPIITIFPKDYRDNFPLTVKSYQGEKATIDGGVSLNWDSCEGNSMCGSHPNSENIFISALPETSNSKTVKLTHGQRVIPITRDIPALDDFFYDNVSNGHLIPEGFEYTNTSLQDPNTFTHPDSEYYIGKEVWINTCNNNFFKLDIISYVPSTHTVTFSSNIPCDQRYLVAGKNKYVVANNPDTLRQGEYYFDTATNSAIYWPKDGSNPDLTVRVADKVHGIQMSSRDNIVLDGIDFRNFISDSISDRVGTGRKGKNLMIKKGNFVNAGSIRVSTIDNFTFTRNSLIQNEHLLPSKIDNMNISYNYVTRGILSGIGSYQNTNSRINHNTVENAHSHHGNAITGGYIANNGLLVDNNFVRNANLPLTFGGSKNLTYKNNVFESMFRSNAAVQGWNHTKTVDLEQENVIMENNTFIGRVNIGENYNNVTVRNNILFDGTFRNVPGANVSNNLYLTDLSSGNTLASDDILEKDWSKIFVDYKNFDYRLLPNSNIGELTNTGFATTMSSQDSYVGALEAVACEGNGSSPIITIERSEMYSGDILEAHGDNTVVCGSENAILSYTWKVNGSIIDSGASKNNISYRTTEVGVITLILEIEDSIGNITTTSQEVYLKNIETPGQVLYISGNNSVLDSSLRQNHATWYGEEKYSSGVDQEALYFPVTEGGYVKTDDIPDLVGMDTFSLSVWAKRDDITRKEKILDMYKGYYIGFEGNQLRYFLHGSGKPLYSNSNYNVIEDAGIDTQWHNYIMTYDGVSVKLYIDGKEVSESIGTTVGSIVGGTRGLALAYDVFGGHDNFHGAIDELRVFNRLLTPQEINLYSSYSTEEESNKDDSPNCNEDSICGTVSPPTKSSGGGGGGGGRTNNSSLQELNPMTPVKTEIDLSAIKKDLLLKYIAQNKKDAISSGSSVEVPKLRTTSGLVQKDITKNIKAKTSYKQNKKYTESCETIEKIKNTEFYLKDQNDYFFTDEVNSTKRLQIRKMKELGVVSGYSDGSFGSKNGVTRTEFLKILLKSHCHDYSEISVSGIRYVDVDTFSWQARVISKAQELELINGDIDENGNPVFRPNNIITKLEALKIILNMSEIQVDETSPTLYKDVQIPWQKRYVEMGESLGLFDANTENNIFNSDSSVSREDMIDLIDATISLYK